MELDHTLTSRDVINGKITAILDEATDKWGIKVNRVEVKNIIPPREIQEAMEKRAEIEAMDRPRTIRWHMIGHVQSRKASIVAGAFDLIHSLDSIRLATALEKHCAGKNAKQKVLIEVNVGEEPQKTGVEMKDLDGLAADVIEKCPHLELQGLMCIPPVYNAGAAARPYFARLRELRDKLSASTGLALPHLSMGMSGDFEWAIEEGATFVRVGTDIFGPRPPKKS